MQCAHRMDAFGCREKRPQESEARWLKILFTILSEKYRYLIYPENLKAIGTKLRPVACKQPTQPPFVPFFLALVARVSKRRLLVQF